MASIHFQHNMHTHLKRTYPVKKKKAEAASRSCYVPEALSCVQGNVVAVSTYIQQVSVGGGGGGGERNTETASINICKHDAGTACT